MPSLPPIPPEELAPSSGRIHVVRCLVELEEGRVALAPGQAAPIQLRARAGDGWQGSGDEIKV